MQPRDRRGAPAILQMLLPSRKFISTAYLIRIVLCGHAYKKSETCKRCCRVLNSFPERLQNDTPAGAPRHFCRNEQTTGVYFFTFAHLIQKNCLKPRNLRLFSNSEPQKLPNFFKLFPLNVYFKRFLAFCPME